MFICRNGGPVWSVRELAIKLLEASEKFAGEDRKASQFLRERAKEVLNRED